MNNQLAESVRDYVTSGLATRRDFPGTQSRFNNGEYKWLTSSGLYSNPHLQHVSSALQNGTTFEDVLDVARGVSRSRDSGLLMGYALPEPSIAKRNLPQFEKGVKDGQIYRIKADGAKHLPELMGGLAATLTGFAWNGLSHNVPREAAHTINAVQGAAQTLGLMSLTYGIYAMVKSNLFSNDARLSAKLETTGPFALHRNPFYFSLGALTVATLAPFAVANTYGDTHWPSLALLAAGLTMAARGARNYVRNEELSLEKQFGEEYVDYKARTPRWIPKLGRKKSKTS